MKEIRPRRLQNENKDVLKKCLPLLKTATAAFARPYRNVFPLVREFAHFPEVKAILDPSVNEDFAIEDFDALVPRIPELVANWKAKVQEQLDELLRKQITDLPTETPYHDLVLTQYLRCTCCSKILSTSCCLPALHDCTRRYRPFSTSDNTYERTLTDLGMKMWSPGGYVSCASIALIVLEADDSSRIGSARS